jgi:organic hydroperoxide reductase OsmC/OhrA
MSASHTDQHRFESRLVWTGATKGGTASYESYSREYRIDIKGKPSIRGTAAVPFRGDPALPNPEDLLVASLSACHFLSYAALCARGGVNLVAYEDDAEGTVQRVDGVFRFTEVVLHPKVSIAAGSDTDKARAFHAEAHAICFIANSVNFPVRNEPAVAVAAPV